jgi:ribosomal protein S18 acetylase RimI-like enzyme
VSIDLVVRHANDDDLPDAGRICVEAYAAAGQLDEDTDGDYRRVLADAGSRSTKADVLVAVRGENVIGTVTMCPAGSPFREIARDGEMEFRFLAVVPSAWGTGVSEALIDACDAYARAAQTRALIIGVRDSNVKAQSLYIRHGFSRLPDRDFTPVPGVLLWGFQRMVGPTGLEPMTSSL